MNGVPLYHWTALAVATVIVLPLPVALLLGWTPPWLRERQAGKRLRAYGMLCVYGLVLVNAVPRLADASFATVMTCTNVGFGFIAAAVVLFLLAGRRDADARAAEPVEARPAEAREG